MRKKRKEEEIRADAAQNTHETVINLLKDEPRGKVLDAAGHGALSYKLKKLGFDVVACDLSPENFEAKPIKCNRIDLHKHNDLPYDDASFDYVISVETIEHLENPWHFLRELSRILKPDGVLILTTPNINSISSRAFFCII